MSLLQLKGYIDSALQLRKRYRSLAIVARPGSIEGRIYKKAIRSAISTSFFLKKWYTFPQREDWIVKTIVCVITMMKMRRKKVFFSISAAAKMFSVPQQTIP